PPPKGEVSRFPHQIARPKKMCFRSIFLTSRCGKVMAPNEFFHLPPLAPLWRAIGLQAVALKGKPSGAPCATRCLVPPVGAVTITSDDNNRGRWLEFSQADLIEAELAQGQAVADTFAQASTTPETTARRRRHVRLGADACRSRECRRKRPTP